MRRTQILLAAASATVLTLSACSSSSKAATTSTAAPDATTATADTSGPLSSDTTVPFTVVPSGVHKDEPFCKTATEFNNANSPFDSTNATGDDFKKFFADVVTPGISQLRASAPAELKADVETIVGGFEQLGKVFATNNWDLAKTAADPDLKAQLNSQTFADAGNRLDAYCGFSGS